MRLRCGNHHVVDADRNAGAGGVQEAEVLHLIQHADGDMQAELQVAVLHQLRETLLLQQTVDERHVFGKMHRSEMTRPTVVSMYCFTYSEWLGVDHVLAVERLGQIDDLAGVAQFDRGQCFHFAHFERDQNVVGGSESTAFAFGTGAHLGEVVTAEHHVLRGNRDGPPCAGDRMLFEASISVDASICASGESGM